MKRLMALIATVSSLLFIAADSRAGVLWTYDFTPSSPSVTSDSGLNQIIFENQGPVTVEGSSKVTAANFYIKTPFVKTGPENNINSDFFDHQNYSIKMTLKDEASGDFTDVPLTFSGDLHGPITSASAILSNTFDPANQTHVVELGDYIYTVTINEYASPPRPGAGIKGAISGLVTITPKGGEEPHDTPEPSSMLLAGFGLAGFGLNAWRKRRQQRA